MNRSSAFPSAEVARALHDRLLAGDGTAAGDVYQAFLDPLIAFLEGQLPREDPDLWFDASVEALTDYVKNPQQYNPQRHPNPSAYLRMAARGDALNSYQREERRRRHRKFVVELEDELGNDSRSDDGPVLRLLTREEEEAEAQRVIEALEKDADPDEIAVLHLMFDGVRATARYAAALGISHLPIDEQRRIVKRYRDRWTKRFERYKRHA